MELNGLILAKNRVQNQSMRLAGSPMVNNIVYLNGPYVLMIPVSKIHNKLRKNPGPGPVSRKLQRAWSELVGVDIVAQALRQLTVRRLQAVRPGHRLFTKARYL
jgi:hypothetical protein